MNYTKTLTGRLFLVVTALTFVFFGALFSNVFAKEATDVSVPLVEQPVTEEAEVIEVTEEPASEPAPEEEVISEEISEPVPEETTVEEVLVEETEPVNEERVTEEAQTEEVVTEDTSLQDPVEEEVILEIPEQPAPLAIEIVEEEATQEVTTEPTEEVAGATTVAEESTQTPELSTDKDDYNPGEKVTLFGRFFTPVKNFFVRIFGNSEVGNFFSDTTYEVTTDEDGEFTLEHQLDNFYRPYYDVTATNEDGEVMAEMQFLDAAGASVDVFSQCANDDGDGYNGNPGDCSWTNGNMNSNNSTILEEDSTVQRLVMSGLVDGMHVVTLEYQTTKGGKHAYDFLTDFDQSEDWVTRAHLCDGAATTAFPSCATTPIVGQSPDLVHDPLNTNGTDDTNQNITIYNGVISSTTLPVLVSGSYAADSLTQINVIFEVDTDNCADVEVDNKGVESCPVFMAWGAHVSSQADWGEGQSAVNISGSPYHMKVVALDGPSTGNRDNQMQADAIIVPATGIIEVDKVTIPAADPQSFDFTLDGGEVPINFALTDQEIPEIFILDEGTYDVTESTPAGWELTDVTCVSSIGDTETADALELDPEETITCTFTNTKQGQIIVEKEVVGADKDFDFTGDITATLGDGDASTLVSVAPGQYTVEEGADSDYALTGISCDDGNSAGDTGARTATFNVEAGETVTCTFTNSEIPTLTLEKTVVNDNGGEATEADFQAQIDGGNVDWDTAYPQTPGSYTASEVQNVSNYTAGDWGGDCATDGSVTLAYGDHKTCTITNNDDPASLILVKNVITDDGGTADASDWTLSAGDNDVTGSESGAEATDQAGVYALSESSLPGYTNTSITCDNTQGEVTEVTIGIGDTVTCTFINDDVAPTLKLVKEVTNDNGGDAVADDWTLTATGNGGFSNDGGSGVFETVIAGVTYTLGESGPDGYSAGDWSCDGGTQNGAEITLGLDDDVTCTIVNNDIAPSITLIKEVINDDGGSAGPNDFGITIGGNPATSGQSYDVDANTDYALDEAGLSGYEFVSLTGDAKCPQILGGTVNLDEDEHITCTITNTDQPAYITVTKVVNNNYGGTALPDQFLLTLDGNAVTSGVQTKVNPGTYTADETLLPGYTFDGFSGDCDADGDVTVALGESKTCTLTNSDIQPQLTLVKTVNNNYGGTLGVSDFPLFVDATPVNSGEANGFNAGSYTASETQQPGYSAGDWGGDCAADGSVTLAIGESKTCTITNSDLPGSISGYKFEDVNGNGVWDNGEPALENWTINLNDDEDSDTTDVNGYYEFTGLSAGAYDVTETQQNGWMQTTPNPSTINLANDEDVTDINFGNFELGDITGRKYNDENGDGSIAGDPTLNGWTIRLYDAGENPWVLVDSYVTAGDGQYEFTDLTPGNYKVCEVLQTGWVQTFASSGSANNSPNSSEEGPECQTVNIDTSGETNTKNFGNYEAKALEVAKDAETTYKRTFDWTIEKSVDPETINLFKGDSQDADYTVTVTKDAGTDSDWAVTGTITITNPNPASTGLTATLDTVTDAMTGGVNAVVDCGGATEVPADSYIECTYSADLPDATSRVNTATVETIGIVGGGVGTSSVTFGEPDTLVNDEVDVTDLLDANPEVLLGATSTNATYTYSHEYSCDRDEGQHDNTASVVGDNDAVLDTDDALVTVNCYDLEIEKTAHTSYIRTFDWTIEKSTDVDALNLFKGDSDEIEYTVEVTKDSGTDSDHMVSGTITITNSTVIDAEIADVSDELTGAIGVTVDCGVVFPYTLVASSTLECSYEHDLDDDTELTNTATVELDNGTEYSDDADVTFGEPDELINDEVDVYDLLDGLVEQINESTSTSAVYTYKYEYSCDSDEGTHTNVAAVTGDDDTELDSDDATIDVNCYDLTVEKDANTSFTRTWTWEIDKIGSVTELDLAPGMIYPVDYDVEVDATSEDSAWAVTGTITITNPAPINASLATVTDAIFDGIEALVSCPSLTVLANDTLECTYSADLPNADTRTNTATAELTNGTEYSGNASVDFTGATMTEIDEMIDLTDTLYGNLGTVDATVDTLPKSYEYTIDVGPYEQEACGETYQVDNTAELTTNDTSTSVDDSWNVEVRVQCVCSLTQGFWKTHNDSFHGGAPSYDGWYNLAQSKELTEFYLSGQTWYEVFWTAPKGNAYYNMAHQYEAAKLNYLNGAWAPGIAEALADAEDILNTYTPSDLEPPKGKAKKAWMKTMSSVVDEVKELAGVFGAFNEGETNPAGHCSEPPIVTLQ